MGDRTSRIRSEASPLFVRRGLASPHSESGWFKAYTAARATSPATTAVMISLT